MNGRAHGRRRGLQTAGPNAVTSDVRVSNWRATLRAVAEQEQTSRAELARRTGLTRGTMSGLVADLIKNGLVVELGAGPSAGGKPPTLLALNAAGREVVALDLSRQPFQAIRADLRGRVLRRIEAPSAGLVGEAAFESAEHLVGRLLAETSVDVVGVGIGCPGLVTEDGRIVEAANLGWRDLPLATRMANRTGLPLWVANDADAAALAERSSFSSSDNVAVVKIGAGIGLGLILNGYLYHGTNAAAGEIGHIAVVRDGPVCACGSRGCLETVASVPGIRAAVAQGLTLAEAIDLAGRHLASVLASLVGILDLPEIVIALEWPEAEDQLLQTVRRHLDNVLTPAIQRTVVVRSSGSASDLILRGTTALVLSEELGLVLGVAGAHPASTVAHG